jgi:hypothetical protein
MAVTFSTCLYLFKSKVDFSIYIEWLNNFISIVNNFNLVIYTDENIIKYIDTKNNSKIKIILKPIESFYNYKYKTYWIKNHDKNTQLNNMIDWRVNMLWNEKLWFVNDTIQNKYFENTSDMYGWCDIGYFRNRKDDLNINELSDWANNSSISILDKNKIHYACVNNNKYFIDDLIIHINNKNNLKLPTNEICPTQVSIGGGFFIINKNKIHWWCEIYNNKLELYFNNDYLVKDDQIILADCIFSNDTKDNFILHYENNFYYDNWFMFQRILQ